MRIRRAGQRWLALLITLIFAAGAAPSAQAEVLGDGPAVHALAKKKKKRRKKRKKKAALVEKAAPAEATAGAAADPAPAEAAAPGQVAPAPEAQPAADAAAAGSIAPAPVTPAEVAPAGQPTGAAPAAPAMTPFEAAPQAFEPSSDSSWGGFFLSLNVGYASSGGKAGPRIPPPTRGGVPLSTNIGQSWTGWQDVNCVGGGVYVPRCYDVAVSTDGGAGLAAALQVGYNILGYFSFWGDFSWHGSFGSKTDTAGAGTVAAMLGLHPLRLWRADLPVDLKLYGGYGFFEILYYYEMQLDAQMEAKGKSWLGSAIPFGLSFEYRISDSVFALGADLRFVAASYNEWIYNYDNDEKSVLTTPETTFRFEPRLIMGWHF